MLLSCFQKNKNFIKPTLIYNNTDNAFSRNAEAGKKLEDEKGGKTLRDRLNTTISTVDNSRGYVKKLYDEFETYRLGYSALFHPFSREAKNAPLTEAFSNAIADLEATTKPADRVKIIIGFLKRVDSIFSDNPPLKKEIAAKIAVWEHLTMGGISEIKKEVDRRLAEKQGNKTLREQLQGAANDHNEMRRYLTSLNTGLTPPPSSNKPLSDALLELRPVQSAASRMQLAIRYLREVSAQYQIPSVKQEIDYKISCWRRVLQETHRQEEAADRKKSSAQARALLQQAGAKLETDPRYDDAKKMAITLKFLKGRHIEPADFKKVCGAGPDEPADKFVQAVRRTQDAITKQLPDSHPMKNNPLLADGIWGNKTQEAAIVVAQADTAKKEWLAVLKPSSPTPTAPRGTAVAQGAAPPSGAVRT